MRERTTTVTMGEQGRVYIPEAVRKALDIDGDPQPVEITVRIEERDDG